MKFPSKFNMSPCLLLATFKDTALFFACKRTMSEMKSCISRALHRGVQYPDIQISKCQYPLPAAPAAAKTYNCGETNVPLFKLQ